MKRTNYKKTSKMGRRNLLLLMMFVLMMSAVILLGGCGQDKDETASGEASTAVEGITSLEQLKKPDMIIGVPADTNEYEVVEKEFPEAEIVYAKDNFFAYTSVAQGKIDAFACNRLNLILAIKNGQEGVRLLDETIGTGNDGGVGVSRVTKIPNLKDKLNEFLKEIEENGTLAEIKKRWLEDLDMNMPDIPEAKNPKYHLVVGTTAASEPFTCYVNNELVGYDMELAKRFALWLGASLEIKVYGYEGIVAAAQGGDVDCIFANLYITPERAEVIDFSTPTYTVDVGVLVQDTGSGETAAKKDSSLEKSFYVTFVREDRWKMFLGGIVTTLLITMLSIVFGTVIGFVVFLLCRRGNPVANTIARFGIWLIDGMPVVVLLMILYYVVFSEARVSGVFVSVIAFTLIFAAAVFSMLKTAVAAVDPGQMEAAYSLGYTESKAFFKIILPQALPLVMPNYKTQIKALIKATAVVGYVAVQDLTKIGDIVRSRTYEAFFPLIAVAVFYFLLAAFLIWIVNRIEIRTLPQRKPEKKKHRRRGERK